MESLRPRCGSKASQRSRSRKRTLPSTRTRDSQLSAWASEQSRRSLAGDARSGSRLASGRRQLCRARAWAGFRIGPADDSGSRRDRSTTAAGCHVAGGAWTEQCSTSDPRGRRRTGEPVISRRWPALHWQSFVVAKGWAAAADPIYAMLGSRRTPRSTSSPAGEWTGGPSPAPADASIASDTARRGTGALGKVVLRLRRCGSRGERFRGDKRRGNRRNGVGSAGRCLPSSDEAVRGPVEGHRAHGRCQPHRQCHYSRTCCLNSAVIAAAARPGWGIGGADAILAWPARVAAVRAFRARAGDQQLMDHEWPEAERAQFLAARLNIPSSPGSRTAHPDPRQHQCAQSTSGCRRWTVREAHERMDRVEEASSGASGNEISSPRSEGQTAGKPCVVELRIARHDELPFPGRCFVTGGR